MAIDGERRARLRKTLTQLVEGTITNDQFTEARQSWECADRAVRIIGQHFVKLCADEREYRLTGPDALDAGNAAIADRCLLFLQTDLEYEWPDAPSTRGRAAVCGASVFLVLPLGVVLLISAVVLSKQALLAAGLACLGMSGLGLCCWLRRTDTPKWRAYWNKGEREAWPFLRRTDCEQARTGVAPAGAAPDGGPATSPGGSGATDRRPLEK